MLTEHVGDLTTWLTLLGHEHYERGDEAKHKEVMDKFLLAADLLCFMKPMSAPRGSEDFAFLNEHEWRVLRVPRLETKTEMVRVDGENPDLLALILMPEDLRILVFPDRRTQELAGEREELPPIIERRPVAPVMLTLADAAEL